MASNSLLPFQEKRTDTANKQRDNEKIAGASGYLWKQREISTINSTWETYKAADNKAGKVTIKSSTIKVNNWSGMSPSITSKTVDRIWTSHLVKSPVEPEE